MRTSRKPLPVMPVAMDEGFLTAVLDELDGARDQWKHDRREYERTEHRRLNAVLIIREVGQDMAFMVGTRNVSRGGVSLLHRHMMHLGEPCTVAFPLRGDTRQFFVTGRAVHCRHVRGLLHEVGIRFDRPISEPDFQRILEQGRELLRPAAAQAADPAKAAAPTGSGHDQATP